MIFLDWLLRFHPIIIILLQGQGCYLDTGSWAKTEIMVVSQSLSGSLSWSHGHTPGALICLWATSSRQCSVSCAPDSGLRENAWLFRHTRHFREWYYKPHIDTHADHRQVTEPCSDHVQRMLYTVSGCLMSDGGRLESAVTSPRPIWLSVTIVYSPWLVSKASDCCLRADWQFSSKFLESSQSSAGRNKLWSVSDIQDWISIFYLEIKKSGQAIRCQVLAPEIRLSTGTGSSRRVRVTFQISGTLVSMTSERQLTIPSKFCNHFSGNSSWTGLGATASGTTPLAKTNAFIEGPSYYFDCPFIIKVTGHEIRT